MPDVLIFADTVRAPELRHEIPHAVADPFIYGEHAGRRFVVLRSLEAARMREVPGVEVVPEEELGADELRAGIRRAQHAAEAATAAVAEILRAAEVAGGKVMWRDRMRRADHRRPLAA